MTDRSVPFIIGKGTSLRFDRADIKSVEKILGVGYPLFTRQGIFGSLTVSEALLWRGLRMEAPDGKLLHAFPLNDEGQEEAGDLLMNYLQEGFGNAERLNDAFVEALIASGLFYKKAPETKPAGDAGSESPKN